MVFRVFAYGFKYEILIIFYSLGVNKHMNWNQLNYYNTHVLINTSKERILNNLKSHDWYINMMSLMIFV